MDMQIDSQLVKSERERRAWSQSHLASVSELGLRTVQRIEATGAASYESAAAIAAAFSMTVADFAISRAEQLDTLPSDRGPRASLSVSVRKWLPRARTAVQMSLAALASLAVIFVTLSYRAVLAEDVLVDIGVALDDGKMEHFGPIPGRRGGLGTDDFHIHLRSELLDDGSIKLQVQVYEPNWVDEDLLLISESDFLTSVGATTELQLGSASGRRYTVSLTPNSG